MTVRDLITELQRFPLTHTVHLDISLPDDEREVFHPTTLAIQPGFKAVAIHSGNPVLANEADDLDENPDAEVAGA